MNTKEFKAMIQMMDIHEVQKHRIITAFDNTCEHLRVEQEVHTGVGVLTKAKLITKYLVSSKRDSYFDQGISEFRDIMLKNMRVKEERVTG